MYLDLTKIILKWYYDNKRILPWRKNNRKKLDPYKVWISEIMLQQTSVNTVVKRYEKFLIKFPNIFELSDSNLNRVLEEWAGLGYYSRARNLHASARILVKKYKGIFPEDEKKLLTLPGIGLYTSGAIRALAFNKYDIAVDVNAERVVSRIFTIKKTINYKNLIRKKTFLMVPKNKSGDFAEALMDIGALICKKNNPICNKCPVGSKCESFNLIIKKEILKSRKMKTVRKGKCFVIQRKYDGKLLFFRNPPKGLLGSMLVFPSYGWFKNNLDDKLSEFVSNYTNGLKVKKIKRKVIHDFSHFRLQLELYYVEINHLKIDKGKWLDIEGTREKLPSLMRKVMDNVLLN